MLDAAVSGSDLLYGIQRAKRITMYRKENKEETFICFSKSAFPLNTFIPYIGK